MDGNLVKKDEEQRARNLRLIHGGKPAPGGKEPPHEDWLTPLTVDTVFLTRPRKEAGFDLLELTVVCYSDKCCYLWIEDKEIGFWVDCARFSNFMELVDVIRIGESND